jgi:glycolate oxidase
VYKFPADAGAIVLVELDGEPDGIEAAVLACGAVCEAEGAREVVIARDDVDRERLWQTRRVCSTALREAYKFKLSEDTVVPPSSIPEMLRRVDAIGARHDLETASFGHAGDGNLHINLLSQETTRAAADSAFLARVDAAVAELFKATLDLGGTLSGEHGIGIAKARYMAWEQSPEVIEWQQRLKRLWDPKNLLNPGKIFAA